MNRQMRQAFRRILVHLRRGWTQGALAKDRNGKFVPPTSPNAISWCLVGAMHLACQEEHVIFCDLVYHVRQALGISDEPFVGLMILNELSHQTKDNIIRGLSLYLERMEIDGQQDDDGRVASSDGQTTS